MKDINLFEMMQHKRWSFEESCKSLAKDLDLNCKVEFVKLSFPCFVTLKVVVEGEEKQIQTFNKFVNDLI